MHEPNETGFFARVGRFFREQAFYLILFLCVAAIGVTAWLFTTAIGSTKPESGEELAKRVTSAPYEPDTPDTLPDDAYSWMSPSIAPRPAAVDAPDLPVQPEADEASEAAAPAEEAEAPAEADAAEVMASAFAWPLSGDVCQGYSVDSLLYDRTMADWRTHAAMDIEGDPGEKIKAAADGTVERIYTDPMYGVTVILYHGAGLRSVYANLAGTPAVDAGDAVALGQVIGSIGGTADAENGDVSHLHFAMTLDELRVNPMDYLPTK